MHKHQTHMAKASIRLQICRSLFEVWVVLVVICVWDWAFCLSPAYNFPLNKMTCRCSSPALMKTKTAEPKGMSTDQVAIKGMASQLPPVQTHSIASATVAIFTWAHHLHTTLAPATLALTCLADLNSRTCWPLLQLVEMQQETVIHVSTDVIKMSCLWEQF